MTGISVTDLRITRALNVTTRIAGFDRFHAFQVVEDGLQAPEAAACQRGYIYLFTHKYLQIGAQYGHRRGRSNAALLPRAYRVPVKSHNWFRRIFFQQRGTPQHHFTFDNLHENGTTLAEGASQQGI